MPPVEELADAESDKAEASEDGHLEVRLSAPAERERERTQERG